MKVQFWSPTHTGFRISFNKLAVPSFPQLRQNGRGNAFVTFEALLVFGHHVVNRAFFVCRFCHFPDEKKSENVKQEKRSFLMQKVFSKKAQCSKSNFKKMKKGRCLASRQGGNAAGIQWISNGSTRSQDFRALRFLSLEMRLVLDGHLPHPALSSMARIETFWCAFSDQDRCLDLF